MQGHSDPDVQQEEALGFNDPGAFLWAQIDPLADGQAYDAMRRFAYANGVSGRQYRFSGGAYLPVCFCGVTKGGAMAYHGLPTYHHLTRF